METPSNTPQINNTVRPVGTKILVKLPPVSETTRGGIIIKTGTRDLKCTIIDRGSAVSSNFKIGDEILIEAGQFQLLDKIRADLKDYAIIEQKFIIGHFTNDD